MGAYTGSNKALHQKIGLARETSASTGIFLIVLKAAEPEGVNLMTNGILESLF